MITDFKLFGIEHLLSLFAAFIIGTLFIFLAKKYPEKKKIISIILAITIIIIRSVRYGFDIYLNEFKIIDLFSLHICHINLILLIVCLIKPNKKLFVFNFLIGIPTALAVALMPGSIHPEPGMLRAIFFIMSHSLLVIGALYLLITYNFKIEKKDMKFYYIFSFIGIIIIYIFNTLTKANHMYLKTGPKGTILEKMYNLFGPFFYVVSIYLILMILLTILYYLYIIINKKINKRKINH